jgi:hypothetical protein
MPFSFRKSKSLGPLRLTLGKRGVGVSAGARGARLSRSATGRRTVSFGNRGLRWWKRV